MSAYLKFFELEQSPFEGKAQSQVVLGTRALRDAFALIRSGLEDGDARICVSGGAGLGKTSLARALPKLLGETTRVAVVLDPDVSWESARGSIAKQWGVPSGGLARAGLVETAIDRRLVLVIDQAERASEEFLDHLDIILSYRSENDEPVVQSVLLARLSGEDRAEPAPIMWWLDRIHTLQLEFAPLPRNGIESYIRKHLNRAGWRGQRLFTEEAAFAIHEYTGGIPGEISRLCERLLTEAAELDIHDIDGAFVNSFCNESPVEVSEEVSDEDTEAPPADVEPPTIELQVEPLTIELEDVVPDPDSPPMLAESLEQFEGDETESLEQFESDEVEQAEEVEEAESDEADEAEYEPEPEPEDLEDDDLTAPASPEELRAIVGGTLGRQGRAFAAAAIAAVIGGLAFVWLSGDPVSPQSTDSGRRELSGFERPNSAAAVQSATEERVSEPILARLRGPVSNTGEVEALEETQPVISRDESARFEIAGDPVEADGSDGSDEELLDMRPAAMDPGASEKSPFESGLE